MPDHRLLAYFRWDHLPDGHMRAVSARFSDLAHDLVAIHAEDPAEQTVALRKLLEAKDAAVRSVIPMPMRSR